MADPYLYASAPVLAVDGSVQPRLATSLVHLEVEEDVEGLKRLRARFEALGPNSDEASGRFPLLDGSVLDFGRDLRVSLGPAQSPRVVFDGRISALEIEFADGATPQVQVLAEDRLMDLRMTRRSKTYRDVSDADIARSIAAEHSLRAEVAADGPVYDVVQQLNQSDLAFLRGRAHALQAELWILDETLHMATRDHRTATSVTLVHGNGLLAAELRADLAHQRTAVRMTGYDAAGREPIDELAGSEVVDAETAGGRTGPAVLRGALGEREAHIARRAPLTGAEASAWARAEMLSRARRFVSVRATTSGTPDLVVGSRVRLERVGTPFEGDGYYVTQVRHSYDLSAGHRTHFDAERATLATGVAA